METIFNSHYPDQITVMMDRGRAVRQEKTFCGISLKTILRGDLILPINSKTIDLGLKMIICFKIL